MRDGADKEIALCAVDLGMLVVKEELSVSLLDGSPDKFINSSPEELIKFPRAVKRGFFFDQQNRIRCVSLLSTSTFL